MILFIIATCKYDYEVKNQKSKYWSQITVPCKDKVVLPEILTDYWLGSISESKGDRDFQFFAK